MNYTIYKPNPKNTGGLANFKTAKVKNQKKDMWESILFVEFVPQKGWNDEKKTGSFDADKKRFVAINVAEAGEFLYSMQERKQFQNYHKSGERACWVKFGHYNTKRKISQGQGKDDLFFEVDNFVIAVSEKGNNVSVPISAGEGQVLKLLLESYIKESMALTASEESKKFKASQKGGSEKEEDETSDEDPEENSEEDGDEYEDDGIPF